MSRQRTKDRPGQPRPPHLSRRIFEEPHDVYGSRGKLPEPSACSRCGASYHEGRWVWTAAPSGAHAVICPACRRIDDDYPAAVLRIAGSFARTHREEIEGRIHNLESDEKAEHPLSRSFGIDEQEGELEVRTTSTRLARAIAHTLHRTYRGTLEEPPPQSDGPLRIRWTRD